MRHLSASLAVLTLLVGSTSASARAGPSAADQAAQAAKPDTERTVSLVVRVRPERIKKVSSDLARMVQGGEPVGLPWLKEAFGAISAEIVVEDAAPSGSTSTAFRASSDGWVGRARPPGLAADQVGASAPAGPAPSGGAATSAEARYATAMAIIGQHAAAIRDGAVALMEKLPDDKAAELRRQIQQLTTASGDIGKTLEGVLPRQTTGGSPPPK